MKIRVALGIMALMGLLTLMRLGVGGEAPSSSFIERPGAAETSLRIPPLEHSMHGPVTSEQLEKWRSPILDT